MTRTARFAPGLIAALAASLLVLAASAQSVPLQRVLPQSKSEVEKALRTLQAFSGGRLPILDGFVTSDQPLDRYQRPYYQYSVQVSSKGAGSSQVQVSARITAWYAGPVPAESGYRVLPSNGRLETDLLDRLGEALGVKPGEAVGPAVDAPAPSPSTTSASAAESSAHVPPAPHKPGTLPLTSLGESKMPSRSQDSSASAADQHIQQLSNEAKNLEQILQHQSRPDNLAVVKTAQTAVLQKPEDGASTLFLASPEDEFQIVDTTDSWVHVQISGLSRGWIRRSALQLPPAYDSPVPTNAAEVPQAAPFRQTRQETAAFPGDWAALRGKQVKVIWVQPSSSEAGQADKFNYAKSVFQKTFPELLKSSPPLAGVVIVFDSEDGGMAAATLATLQQWNAHHMTDNVFRTQCWFDPADAFKLKD